MVDDVLKTAEQKMQGSLNNLQTAFSSVRTGRANAMVLDKINVDYYGVPTPINQVAAIKTPDAHMLVVEPWDKGMLSAIEHALVASDLGVTPNNDGSILRLPFPQLTEERRRELVKKCKEYAEEARVAVRACRRDGNSQIAKLVKSENLPEDDQHRGEDDMQKLTDKFIKKIDEAFKQKEDEVMEI